MTTLTQNREALTALLMKAEDKRLARADNRPMDRVRWTGFRWEGECLGAEKTHRPVITLKEGARSFNCTCPDKRDRGHRVGPCKHVISLARVGLWILDEGSIPAVAA